MQSDDKRSLIDDCKPSTLNFALSASEPINDIKILQEIDVFAQIK